MKYPIRNYIKNPLRKGEYPEKEDIYHFYIEQNLTLPQVARLLGISVHKIKQVVKRNQWNKTQEQIDKSRSQLWDMMSDEEKQNRKTQIKAGFTPEIRKRISQAVSEQQANETPEQKELRIRAFKETWSNRTQEQIDSRLNKIRKAHAKRTPEQKKQIIEKFRKTFSQVWATKTDKEKQTYINKMQQTKKERGTFNTSKHENEAFELIIQKYPNTIRQYKSELYPFACDFYIPELELYIEYQESWTHGGKPFISTDGDCKKQLNYWKKKAKTSKFYQVAIQVWTERDVIKRTIAQQNGLNYIEIFNKQQLKEWLNSGLTVN